ncbi:MAG: helix-turn-helix domain-containing protein [Nitrospirota bacterium]
MDISLQIYDFFCPNEYCGDHGKKGKGNIIVYNRYGKQHRRLLKCKTCKSKFSERRETFFFGMHTKEKKIKEVIECLLKGMSYRETAVTTEIDKDTVQRIWKRFLGYCEESLNSLLKEFDIKLEDVIMLLYNRTFREGRY